MTKICKQKLSDCKTQIDGGGGGGSGWWCGTGAGWNVVFDCLPVSKAASRHRICLLGTRHHPPGDAPCRLLSQLGHFDSDEHSEEVKRRRRRRSRSYAQPQQAGQAAQEEMRHKWPQGSSGADNDAAPASTLFVPDLEQAVSIHLLCTAAHQAGWGDIKY